MKFFNTNYLYVFSLFIFIFIHTFLKPKPNFNEISLKYKSSDLVNEDLKKNLNVLNSPDRRFNIGNNFFINDGENWYVISQFSFWDKRFLQLGFIDKQLKIINLEVKKKGNSNYALATYNNENVAYACIEDSKNFFYDIYHDYIPEAKDINHWKKVFLRNIKTVIFLFKPKNYECFFVLTSNIKFFEGADQEINNLIFEKFNY